MRLGPKIALKHQAALMGNKQLLDRLKSSKRTLLFDIPNQMKMEDCFQFLKAL